MLLLFLFVQGIFVAVVSSQQPELTPNQVKVVRLALIEELKLHTGDLSPNGAQEVITSVLNNPVVVDLTQKLSLEDAPNSQDSLILLAAASIGRWEIVQGVLDNGAQLYHLDINGWTALHYATSNNHTEVTVYLIDLGIDVNWKTYDTEETALFFAVSNSNLQMAEVILKVTADVNVRNKFGDTPLNIAASKGHLGVVELFIRNGALIDVQNEGGSSALLVAVYEKHWKVAQELLAANANPNLKTIYGDHALNLAVGHGKADIVKELLTKGAELDVPNVLGYTALSLAAKFNSPEEARLLLSRGANVNTQATDGDTPLMIAVNNECMDVVKVLLEHCPDLSVTKNGKTALTIASDKQNMQILSLIQAHPNIHCSHDGNSYVKGYTRSDECQELQCCQGRWSMTGTTSEFCDEGRSEDRDREIANDGRERKLPRGERISES